MLTKGRWAKDIIDRLQKKMETTQRVGRPEPSREQTIRKWAKEKWEERWSRHLDLIPTAQQTPAHSRELGHARNNLHQAFAKQRAH